MQTSPLVPLGGLLLALGVPAAYADALRDQANAIFKPIPDLSALNAFLPRVVVERAHGNSEITCSLGMREPLPFELLDFVIDRHAGRRRGWRTSGDALQHGDEGLRLFWGQDEAGNQNR